MTVVKTSALMIIVILGMIWSRATTAFVAISPFVTIHSSHYRQHQQQTTTTISLTTSSLTSNDTDTSSSPSTIQRGGGRGGGRAAVVSAAAAAAARQTVAGPREASHVTTMTSRLSFLEERKRLMDSASSLKRPLIDPSTVEICDSEEVNRRLELEIIKSNSIGGGGGQPQMNQQLTDTGHNRRNADRSADASSYEKNNNNNNKNKLKNGGNDKNSNSVYPFALMMQQSARYIAQHWGKTVVFHIPGNLMEGNSNNQKSSVDKLLGDLAQAWILGMKIVVVVGNRFDWDLCDLDATVSAAATNSSSSSSTATSATSSSSAARCSSNALQVTSEETLRLLEEEAGYWRTEVERKLNKCLHGVSHHADHLEGNVVSGNFYTAKRVVAAGRGRGADDCDSDSDDLYDYTGYAAKIHSDTIHRILHDNHDVVVLSTVGLCKNGNLINVNGYHLAASVAASLNAYKVVYMAHQGSVLQQKVPSTSSSSSSRHKRHGTTDSSSSSYRVIQELPISCAKAITDYRNVRVHKRGIATFEHQAAAQQREQQLSPRDIELLLHLGWATWAVERGVTRAHIVNPTDGALLEELFTSKNGANTCIFHDNELLDMMQDDDDDDDVEEIYWPDDDDDDDSSSASQHGYGPILTSPTAFAAKKRPGRNQHHYKNNNQLGRNAAFLG